MFKRLSIMFVLLLAIAVVLSACGGSAPAAPAATTAPAAANGAVPKPAPMPGAKPTDKNATWDKIAGDAAKALGFTNFVYEANELPANSTWDATFKYYSDQMAALGWGGQGTVQDFEGGKVGAFIHADSKTGLVIFFIASPDGTKSAYDLAIFGN